MKLFEEHPLPWRYRELKTFGGPHYETIEDANGKYVASADGVDLEMLMTLVGLLTEGQRKFLGNKEPHN